MPFVCTLCKYFRRNQMFISFQDICMVCFIKIIQLPLSLLESFQSLVLFSCVWSIGEISNNKLAFQFIFVQDFNTDIDRPARVCCWGFHPIYQTHENSTNDWKDSSRDKGNCIIFIEQTIQIPWNKMKNKFCEYIWIMWNQIIFAKVVVSNFNYWK